MNYKQKVAYLATGLHESGCSRFAREVNKETIRRLEARNDSFGATNG